MSESVTLASPHPWAAGTSVGLYRGFKPPSGVPSGSAVATATVASDMTLTFAGVPEAATYFAYANGQSVAISAPPVGTAPVVSATGPLTSADVDALLAAGQTLYELDASGNVVAEWVKA